MNQKYLGAYIKNYTVNKVIPMRAKVITLVLMWGSMLYCAVFLVPYLIARIALFLVALGVSWHILSFRNK